jgi:hypothetical protein
MGGILGFDEEAYKAFRKEKMGSLERGFDRFVAFTGLDSQWLQTGVPEFLAPPELGEYARAATAARRQGVSPEELEAGVPRIKAIIGSRP